MCKDEKILIYPFNTEVVPLVRSKKFRSKYNDIILCALKGSGYSGKDIGEIDYGEFCGITVTEDFDKCIDMCTSVLFVDSKYARIEESELEEKLEKAKSKEKKIVRIKKNDNYIDDIIESISKDVKKKISDISTEKKYGEILEKAGLIDVTTPIIGVVGTGENTCKGNMQVSIVEKLEELGYKVTWIASSDIYQLIGAHTYPTFMKKNNITDSQQVLLFNRYVKSLEVKERADVIVIGVPGGIMPCSKNIVGDFGVFSYKVFQAVSPDYLALSVFYDDYKDMFFDEIKNHIKYKFGCDINMINICNRRIDWNEVRILNYNAIPYYSIDNAVVDKFINKAQKVTNIKLVDVLRKDEDTVMVEDIIDNLQDDEPNIVF